MSKKPEEFAAWVEPDDRVHHRYRAYGDSPAGRIWYRSIVNGRSVYVLSSSRVAPEGVYVLRRREGSYIHFEIVGDEKEILPLPGSLLPA